ncbi:MAG: ParB/RepB/Spo0J family partition protein [Gammaproteobacteria bacterium]
MTTKNRGLGRGLDALLGGGTRKVAEEHQQSAPQQAASGNTVSTLGIEMIQRGRYQPRRHFDEEKLQELADSIAAQGVVQPIVVRPVGNVYEIVAGERRWRAAQLAGLHEIPAVIREVDDQAAMAMGLIENIQRDDLNPLEEAGALHRLLEEFGLTHQEIAQAVGKSRTTVTNLLRLLELEPEVKAWLDQGKMEMGHARAILGVTGELQVEAANQVVRNGLSVRETERLVRRLQGQEAKPVRKEKVVDPNIRSLEQDLTEKLGARVQLQSGSKGRGKLVIKYNSLDELEGILEHIQ